MRSPCIHSEFQSLHCSVFMSCKINEWMQNKRPKRAKWFKDSCISDTRSEEIRTGTERPSKKRELLQLSTFYAVTVHNDSCNLARPLSRANATCNLRSGVTDKTLIH